MRLNAPLKWACIASEKSQMEIAELAHIHYTRLSQIVWKRVTPTESEKLRIAGVLQRSVSELFPDEAEVTQ